MASLTKQKKEKLIMAVVGPLSGPRSAYGKILEAISKLVCKNPSIDCIFFDDQALPEEALKCAHNIVNSRASVVVGHFNSFCAEIASPIYMQESIPLILPAATKRNLTIRKNVYRVCPHEDKQIAAINRIIDYYGIDKVAVFVDESPYGEHLYNKLNAVKSIEKQISCVDDIMSDTAFKVIVALGIHTEIAKFICSLSLVKKMKIYCCDDALIDEFFHLVGKTNHEIKIFGPNGGHIFNTSLALRIASDCLLKGRSENALKWLHNDIRFDAKREYIGAKYQLYTLKNHTVVQL